jgi:hypothetical protein
MIEVSDKVLALAEPTDLEVTLAGELPGPVLGEFIQTEDEVGKEVLAQEEPILH